MVVMNVKKILVITNDDDVFTKLHFEFDANKYELQRLTNPLLSVEIGRASCRERV